MTWVLIFYMIATGNVMMLSTGFESKEHCEHEAEKYTQNIDMTKFGYSCEYGELKYGKPKASPRTF